MSEEEIIKYLPKLIFKNHGIYWFFVGKIKYELITLQSEKDRYIIRPVNDRDHCFFYGSIENTLQYQVILKALNIIK